MPGSAKVCLWGAVGGAVGADWGRGAEGPAGAGGRAWIRGADWSAF